MVAGSGFVDITYIYGKDTVHALAKSGVDVAIQSSLLVEIVCRHAVHALAVFEDAITGTLPPV